MDKLKYKTKKELELYKLRVEQEIRRKGDQVTPNDYDILSETYLALGKIKRLPDLLRGKRT